MTAGSTFDCIHWCHIEWFLKESLVRLTTPLEHIDFYIINYWMSSYWSLWHISLEETRCSLSYWPLSYFVCRIMDQYLLNGFKDAKWQRQIGTSVHSALDCINWPWQTLSLFASTLKALADEIIPKTLVVPKGAHKRWYYTNMLPPYSLLQPPMVVEGGNRMVARFKHAPPKENMNACKIAKVKAHR